MQFCERVWLQLLVKGIPHEEVLIDLRDKPAWYKELVPTALVPAVKFLDDGKLLWESADIMDEVERRFPAPALVPALQYGGQGGRACTSVGTAAACR